MKSMRIFSILSKVSLEGDGKDNRIWVIFESSKLLHTVILAYGVILLLLQFCIIFNKLGTFCSILILVMLFMSNTS